MMSVMDETDENGLDLAITWLFGARHIMVSARVSITEQNRSTNMKRKKETPLFLSNQLTMG